jgi:hypothetical protein
MNYTPQELREFIHQLARLTDYLDLVLLTEMEHFLITDVDLSVSDKMPLDVDEHQLEWDHSSESPHYWN